MRAIYTIIVLVVLIWPVIQKVLEKAAANRLQRLKDQQRQSRREMEQGRGVPAPARDSSVDVRTEMSQRQSGSDVLAQRRREQIEQLRQRRTAAGAPIDARSVPGRGAPASTSNVPIARRSKTEPQRVRQDRAPQTPAQPRQAASTVRPTQRQARPGGPSSASTPDMQPTPLYANQPAEEVMRLVRTSDPRPQQRHLSPLLHPVHSRPGTATAHPLVVSVPGLAGQALDGKALRTVFIMKEVLDPPVSLRPPPA